MDILKILRQRWKSKTYRANLILALLTGIEVSSGWISSFFPPALRPWLIMAWPLTMAVMREVTTAALSEKEV